MQYNIYIYRLWCDQPAIATHKEPSIGYKYAHYTAEHAPNRSLALILAEVNYALANNNLLPEYLVDTYEVPY
jgi:hypothetical protein